MLLNIRNLKKPSKESSFSGELPFVSILIPARNEAKNIETCLSSLQKQEYPNFEILVLDDNSTDGTDIIVKKIAETDNKIRLIKGQELPNGWNGKAFACHQLASNANGEWLLFVDADTIHKPNMLCAVMNMALKENPSLLSGFPRQAANNIVQKIIIPVFNFFLITLLPLWWLQRDNKPRLSFANGQFLLFKSTEYWRIGGHESVKSRILEDVFLGVQVCRKKGRVLAVDLSPVVTCHMYRTFGQMWHGFAKSIYAFTATPVLLFIAGILAYILFLGPFYAIISHIAFKHDSILWLTIVLFEGAIILFMRFVINYHFKESFFSTIFHPLGFGFFLINALYVLVRRIAGLGVSWKERSYTSNSGVG